MEESDDQKECCQVAKMEYDQMTKKDEKEASTQNKISSGVTEGLTHDVRFQYQMEPYQEDG